MTRWPARLLLNTVYALLLERAREDDRAELVFSPHASEEHQASMAHNVDQLDEWLDPPDPRVARADEAILRELGVA